MKLNTKVSGICASLTFLITAIPGFYQQARPTDFNYIASGYFSGLAVVETIAISLLGALAAGMIGYVIGDILSSPQKVVKPKASSVESPPPPPATEPEMSNVAQDDIEIKDQSELKEPPDPLTEPLDRDDLE